MAKRKTFFEMALRCHVDDLAAFKVKLRPLREDGLLESSGSDPYQHGRWRLSEELAVFATGGCVDLGAFDQIVYGAIAKMVLLRGRQLLGLAGGAAFALAQAAAAVVQAIEPAAFGQLGLDQVASSS